MKHTSLIKLQSFARSTNKQLLLIILGTILITYAFAYVTTVYRENTWPEAPLKVWLRWDTNHYLKIADEGYGSSEDNKNLIAFFPLYPMMIKLFNYFFNNPMLAALTLSNIAYIFAAVYLFKLVSISRSEKTALRTVFYFSIFPSAFYLHAAHTESLFLALIIGSFYYARKGKWLPASIIGIFATATRLTGAALFPALILEYLDQNRFKIKKDFFLLAMVPLGSISYLVLNQVVFGSPFAFLIQQSGIWSKDLSMPMKGFLYHVNALSWADPRGILSINLPEAFYGALGFGMAVYCTIKLRSSLAAFAFLSWLVFTATDFWLSIPRYTLGMFPIFIAFAGFGKNKGFHYAFSFGCIIFYGFYLTRFITGHWAF